MRFFLTDHEQELLNTAAVDFCADWEYTDDEALLILEQIRDIEIGYSQFTTEEGNRLYHEYGTLADKFFAMIPEEKQPDCIQA